MRYILIVLLFLIQCESKEERAYRKYTRKLEEQNRKHQELVREDSVANVIESQNVAKLDSIKRAEEELIRLKKENKFKYVNKWLVITGTENDSIKAVKENREVINTNYYTGLKNDLFVAVAHSSENEKKAKQFGKDSLNGIEYYIKYSGDYLSNGIQVDYKKIDMDDFNDRYSHYANKWIAIINNPSYEELKGMFYSNLNDDYVYNFYSKKTFSKKEILIKILNEINLMSKIDTILYTGYFKNVYSIPKSFENDSIAYWLQLNNNYAIYGIEKLANEGEIGVYAYGDKIKLRSTMYPTKSELEILSSDPKKLVIIEKVYDVPTYFTKYAYVLSMNEIVKIDTANLDLDYLSHPFGDDFRIEDNKVMHYSCDAEGNEKLILWFKGEK